nr:glycosyltransferase [uncultured Draconibacterium sp.]
MNELITIDNKKPLVSVLCQAYNHEPYIRQCLDGIIMQKTKFFFEILVHDDASTDKTADIIKEYEKKYPDLIFPIYQTENQFSQKKGVFSNIQCPRARGKYIAICEGDDYWTAPLKLQKQVDFLENNNEYILCFHEMNILKGNEVYPDFITRNENSPNTFNALLKGNFIHTPSIVFRRKYLSSVNYPKNGVLVLGDYYLLLFLSQYGRFKKISEIMGIYRVHIGGVWSLSESKHKEKRFARTLLELSRNLNKKNYRNATKKKFLKFTLKRILLAFFKLDFETVKYYLTLIRG